MPSFSRSIYDDDSITLIQDKSVSAEGASVTASTFDFVGSSWFSIQLPNTVSGHTGLIIQGNNANVVDPTGGGTTQLYYSTNKLLNQPSMGKRTIDTLNSSFSANWITIASIPASASFYSVSGISVRWIRLNGAAITGSNFVAYVWSDSCARGV